MRPAAPRHAVRVRAAARPAPAEGAGAGAAGRGGPAGPLERRQLEAQAGLEAELRRWWPTPGGPEEAALHHFAAAHRAKLFPGYPWLYEHEWEAGNMGVSFRGDILLFDGAESFLSLEVKILPPPPPPEPAHKAALGEWEELCGARVRQAERQAAVGEVLALHLLAQEARGCGEDGASGASASAEPSPFVYKGPLPMVASAVLTSDFRAEHFPHLSETELRGLREDWAAFRGGLQVVKKRKRWRLKVPPSGEKSPSAEPLAGEP